jgi:hypothetical protein
MQHQKTHGGTGSSPNRPCAPAMSHLSWKKMPPQSRPMMVDMPACIVRRAGFRMISTKVRQKRTASSRRKGVRWGFFGCSRVPCTAFSGSAPPMPDESTSFEPWQTHANSALQCPNAGKPPNTRANVPHMGPPTHHCKLICLPYADVHGHLIDNGK